MRRPHRLMLLVLTTLSFALARPSFAGDKPVVLFDTNHGQKFSIDNSRTFQLSTIADIIRSVGADLRNLSEPITEAGLKDATSLVISGPFKDISDDEATAIAGFIKRGGRVAVMLHIAPPATTLLRRLGVGVTNGPVHERDGVIGGRDLDFRVTRFRPHALTAGVSEFATYGAWGVEGTEGDAVVVAQSGPRSWVDTNLDGRFGVGDDVADFGIIVTGTSGTGQFAVFGDDAIFQNHFLKGGNETLAGNLARWLAGR